MSPVHVMRGGRPGGSWAKGSGGVRIHGGDGRVKVVFGDGSNGAVFTEAGICCSPVVFISGILN